ncbi:hypothetical protein BCR44DRAFT_1438645 [Catenaria anguillulae PL171]|uniref:Uncharacterized protein n=1 Tax=Catenaria anguillulae PL171 TaxID=765915 RepID=A0A1Y2HHA8_9FUNG|nr:hypothetical protein BCR44DRAFT_1438645 [Catenaria anguillulae PL171]
MPTATRTAPGTASSSPSSQSTSPTSSTASSSNSTRRTRSTHAPSATPLSSAKRLGGSIRSRSPSSQRPSSTTRPSTSRTWISSSQSRATPRPACWPFATCPMTSRKSTFPQQALPAQSRRRWVSRPLTTRRQAICQPLLPHRSNPLRRAISRPRPCQQEAPRGSQRMAARQLQVLAVVAASAKCLLLRLHPARPSLPLLHEHPCLNRPDAPSPHHWLPTVHLRLPSARPSIRRSRLHRAPNGPQNA